jgi:hypothetical protein
MKISPSALATHKLCARKWRYNLAMRGQPNQARKSAAAMLGTLGHSCVEEYLRGGSVYAPRPLAGRDADEFSMFAPDEQARLVAAAPARALAGLHFLPPLDRGAETEVPFELDADDVTFHGRVDIVDRAGAVVLDNKFTRDFKYALTAEQLAHDEQGVIYGLWLMTATGHTSAHLRWVYYLTDPAKPPKARCVDAQISCDEALERIVPLRVRGRQMREDALLAPEVLPAPASADACAAYGGCPYHMLRGGPCSGAPIDLAASFREAVGNEQHTEQETTPMEQPSLSQMLANLTGAQAPAPEPAPQPVQAFDAPPLAPYAPPAEPDAVMRRRGRPRKTAKTPADEVNTDVQTEFVFDERDTEAPPAAEAPTLALPGPLPDTEITITGRGYTITYRVLDGQATKEIFDFVLSRIAGK